MANGLTGVDFVRCWLSWSILPLSRRPGLMCEYTGSLKDPQRHIDIQLTEVEVIEAVKKILNEPEAVCSRPVFHQVFVSNFWRCFIFYKQFEGPARHMFDNFIIT